MEKYGYIRVSSRDQNPERQLEALIEYGVDKKNIFTDFVSGKDFNRPKYKALMRKLHSGDVLVVKRIDRLGRNYREILDQWRIICCKKKVDIEVVEFPLLNTNQVKDGLTGLFISDITLQILAYLSQSEREMIKRRQAEGIAIAKAKGIHFGAERKKDPDSFYDYYKMWKDHKISTREGADKTGMSHTTFYRRCIELKSKEEKDGDCSKK